MIVRDQPFFYPLNEVTLRKLGIIIAAFASVLPAQLALLRELDFALFLHTSKIIVYRNQIVPPISCRH